MGYIPYYPITENRKDKMFFITYLQKNTKSLLQEKEVDKPDRTKENFVSKRVPCLFIMT